MKQPQNISEVAALQPDYMGFIFYEKTPRFFEGEIPQIPSAIKKTGVFVDATAEFISDKIKKHELRAIQLHGNESPELCRRIKKGFPEEDIKIIKVFSVKEEFDFSRLKAYEDVVDFFLFDTKGKTKGGTGKTFNWKVLKNYPSSTPFFLSGGIGLEEAGEINKLQAYFQEKGKENLLHAVDVNSRFEIEPGLKDSASIKKFIEQIEVQKQK